MGQGPRLPVAGVLGAVMVDRMRTTVRNGAAAMRGHPAILVPPLVIVLSAAVAYILLVSVDLEDSRTAGQWARRARHPHRRGGRSAGRQRGRPGRAAGLGIAEHLGAFAAADAQAFRGRTRAARRPLRPRPSPAKSTPAPSPSPPAAVARRIADPDGGRYQLDGFRLGLARCWRTVRRLPARRACARPLRLGRPAPQERSRRLGTPSANMATSLMGPGPDWRRHRADRRETSGEPPGLDAVRSDEHHLGHSLPADQGRGGRGAGTCARACPGGGRLGAVAARCHQPKADRRAAAALAVAAGVRVRRDRRAVAAAVRGRAKARPAR